MLKNIYNFITDWLLITWYIIDVSQGINIIEHDISTAILSKSHASAVDKQLFLCLSLKKICVKLQTLDNDNLNSTYFNFDIERKINDFNATNARNGRNV